MSEVTFKKWKEQMVASAKATKTPICATFELTPRCNLDCKMCYVHEQTSNNMGCKELSTTEWKKIFDEAYECGLMFAIVTGGECLLRNDFFELYLHLWKKRVFITVLTNGILMNDEHIELFKKYRPERVQVSLYGSTEDGYKNVTGHKGFEKAVSTIRRLTDAGIPTEVALTPSKYMKNDYMSTLRFCKENGFRYKQSDFLLMKKRDDGNSVAYHLENDDIVRLATERAVLLGKLNLPKCELPVCGGSSKESPKGLVCNAGKTATMISWDGRMCLCTGIPVSKASVLEMPYAEAWEKTKEAAQEILLGMECVGCPYDELCPKCPALRLTGMYTGHCDPKVCEVTRRLVAAGVKKLDEPAKTECNE